MKTALLIPKLEIGWATTTNISRFGVFLRLAETYSEPCQHLRWSVLENTPS